MTLSAVLLVGSPRGFNSTSNSLGSYLLSKLQNSYSTNKFHVQAALHQPTQQTSMLQAVADCDLLVLAFPLYIDCLPAPMIAALEKIAEHRKTNPASKPQQALAIVNNGFPETSQNATALAICHKFADETGFGWAGGLSLGGGGSINGTSLEEAGGVAKNFRKSLDLTAQDLLLGKPVSDEAVQLMAKPVMPKTIYALVANMGWKSMAKKYGTKKKLNDRPAKN